MSAANASRKAYVPLALTGLRAALAPLLLLLAWLYPKPWAFALCLTLAFLSDVFDGIIARRLGVATPALRRLDSLADTLFYAAALAAAWHLHATAIREYWPALAALLLLEVLRYAFDLAKFGREAAYHLWSSKLWGIALFVGFLGLLVWGRGGSFVAAPLLVGIAADLEGLAISFVLRSWKNDIPSIVHAWRMERHSRSVAI